MQASEEGGKRSIQALDDILQDMGVKVFVLWPHLLDGGKITLLLIVGERCAACYIKHRNGQAYAKIDDESCKRL